MRCQIWTLVLSVLALLRVETQAFMTPLSPRSTSAALRLTPHRVTTTTALCAEKKEQEDTASAGVVELGDSEEEEDELSSPATTEKDLPQAVSGPLFISQGEVDPDTLNPDFSDAKQTRVVIYTMLSLLPVLFLIPFMLGRDFIPLDQLPPVEMN